MEITSLICVKISINHQQDFAVNLVIYNRCTYQNMGTDPPEEESMNIPLQRFHNADKTGLFFPGSSSEISRISQS